MKLPVIATTLAAALIASPATAYADPVPTTDEVIAVMAELTDPNIPAANKGNIVTPASHPMKRGQSMITCTGWTRMDGYCLCLLS